MTNAELKLAFSVYYDSIANFASPGYENSEINVFLNKAMDIIIEQLFQAGRIDELNELVTVVKYSLASNTTEEFGDYSYYALISDDFLFYLDSKTKITSRTAIATWSSAQWINNEYTDIVKMKMYVTTSINSPILLHPKTTVLGLKWHGDITSIGIGETPSEE